MKPPSELGDRIWMWTVIGVMTVVGTSVALITVLWLAPAPAVADPRLAAQDAIQAARASTGDPTTAVQQALPDGAWALVVAAHNLLPGQGSDSGPVRIIENTQSVDPAQWEMQKRWLAGHGVVGEARQQGWWAGVVLPPASKPWSAALAAALTVLVTAIATGATADALYPRQHAESPDGSTAATTHGAPRSGTQPEVTDAGFARLPLAAGSAPDPRLTELASQRAELVRGMAQLIGQLPAELVWQANDTLSASGVQTIVADGERFDPLKHQVVGTVPAETATVVDSVARTIRPGYADDHQVFVPARVLVYTADLSDRQPEPGQP